MLQFGGFLRIVANDAFTNVSQKNSKHYNDTTTKDNTRTKQKNIPPRLRKVLQRQRSNERRPKAPGEQI